ncbi:hypothetical protein MMC06_001617 [Schaereria dolodes]|nr:hypothetical protein [Schaereria dolodes]
MSQNSLPPVREMPAYDMEIDPPIDQPFRPLNVQSFEAIVREKTRCADNRSTASHSGQFSSYGCQATHSPTPIGPRIEQAHTMPRYHARHCCGRCLPSEQDHTICGLGQVHGRHGSNWNPAGENGSNSVLSRHPEETAIQEKTSGARVLADDSNERQTKHKMKERVRRRHIDHGILDIGDLVPPQLLDNPKSKYARKAAKAVMVDAGIAWIFALVHTCNYLSIEIERLKELHSSATIPMSRSSANGHSKSYKSCHSQCRTEIERPTAMPPISRDRFLQNTRRAKHVTKATASRHEDDDSEQSGVITTRRRGGQSEDKTLSVDEWLDISHCRQSWTGVAISRALEVQSIREELLEPPNKDNKILSGADSSEDL